MAATTAGISRHRSYNPPSVSISKKYRHHIVSDAATDDLIAKRMLRAREAGYEANFSGELRKAVAEAEGNLHRARHAVRGAVNAPALTVERWILEANASDRASVKTSELRALLDAIKSVAWWRNWGCRRSFQYSRSRKCDRRDEPASIAAVFSRTGFLR